VLVTGMIPLRHLLHRLYHVNTAAWSKGHPPVSLSIQQHCMSTMSIPTSTSRSYESAILALNSLQTNAALLDKVRKERQKNVHLNLPLTAKYLERSGMSLEDLDSIKVIHVSGTKGKGSTCAFTESILRQHGLKTGFYSSPHLVSAVERIRIRGRPIQKETFAKFFWEVYDKVCLDREPHDRPPYFKFLTILAFNIFWREGVDVAIIEVGIGGSYDCTNIIRKPVVSGITALGLDHTSLLGNSIQDIAWHKAGIMKRGVNTFIDGEQQEEALQVLRERSKELGATTAKVPDLLAYDWGEYPVCLGLYGQVQYLNASLAVALSQYFLHKTRGHHKPQCVPDPQGGDINVLQPFTISPQTALGLRVAHWPGRSQTIHRGSIVYFLDGAHTEESVQACKTWFCKASNRSKPQGGSTFKVLLFNMTGDRCVLSLLTPLSSLGLDLVVFCTNMSSLTSTADQTNHTTSSTHQLARCQELDSTWRSLETSVPCVVVPCINDALLWVSQGRDSTLTTNYSSVPDLAAPREMLEADQVQVLVTGSLHLVGGVLAAVQPGMEEPNVDKELVQSYMHQVHHR